MTMTHDAIDAPTTSELIDRLTEVGALATDGCLAIHTVETIALTIDRLHEMVEALDAPVPNHTARSGDPDTSRAAGRRHSTDDVRRFSSKSRQARLLAAFENAGRGGLTAYEAATQIAPTLTVPVIEGTRRRVSDLRAAGYVADSGLRRKNQGSSDEATVYVLTMAGAQARTRLLTTGWSK